MSDKIKILITDDDPDFQQTMVFWFKAKGYIVSTAGSGEEALQQIKESKPDIVFLDLNMPEMDGVDTLIKIREFDKTLPVVMISAHVDARRMAEAAPHNVSGVFYKGKDFSELGSLLEFLEVVLKKHKSLKK